MTRDQALQVVRSITESSVTERQIADLVDCLIALEVLKVEKQKLSQLEALAMAIELAQSSGSKALTSARVLGHLNIFGYTVSEL